MDIKNMIGGLLGGKPGDSSQMGQKPEDKSKPPITDDEKKLANWIKSKVEEIRGNGTRISHEGIWMTNIAYLLGFSGTYFDATTREFRSVGSKDKGLKRNRIHVNKILPTIQNRLSRLIKSRPKYQVRPNSNDATDKEAARLSEQVLDMIWDKEKVATKYIDLLMWVQQIGHSYLKVCWDVAKGEMITDPMSGEADYEGDIRIDVVSGFELFADPVAKTLDESGYVIQAKIRKLDYFKTHYPEKGEEVREEGPWLLSVQYEGRINTINTRGPTGSSWSQQMKDAAIELAYYERPTKQFPKGRLIIAANGVVLEDKELPCGVMPFVKFDDITVSGKYFSESVITHLRPIQDQYNRVITKRAEWTNKLLAGKYLTARGSGIAAEALNDQSGEVLEYNVVPNAPPPSALQIPNIPSYAYEEEQALDRMFNDISGINEVSKGQSPGQGITAGIALQWLSEQDSTRIGVMSRRNELALAELFGLVLRYVGEYYKTPRLLKIAGQNNGYQVKSFVGTDLQDNHDVTVIEGSTLPESLTAKRDYILTYWQQGILGDPQDPKIKEKVARMLEFGDVGDIWADEGLDMNQTQEHIQMIEQGQMPEVSEFDNHEFALKELNRYRKGDKFKSLDPMKQQMLIELMNRHLDELTNRQMDPNQQQQLQNMPDLANPAVGDPMGAAVNQIGMQHEAAGLSPDVAGINPLAAPQGPPPQM